MNKSLRNLLIAGLLVAALFSIPLWTPELLAKNVIAQESLGNSENPFSESDPIILLDAVGSLATIPNAFSQSRK